MCHSSLTTEAEKDRWISVEVMNSLTSLFCEGILNREVTDLKSQPATLEGD